MDTITLGNILRYCKTILTRVLLPPFGNGKGINIYICDEHNQHHIFSSGFSQPSRPVDITTCVQPSSPQFHIRVTQHVRFRTGSFISFRHAGDRTTGLVVGFTVIADYRPTAEIHFFTPEGDMGRRCVKIAAVLYNVLTNSGNVLKTFDTQETGIVSTEDGNYDVCETCLNPLSVEFGKTCSQCLAFSKPLRKLPDDVKRRTNFYYKMNE